MVRTWDGRMGWCNADGEGDLTFYVVRAPTLRWDTRNGVIRLPVVKFRRLRRADTNEPK